VSPAPSLTWPDYAVLVVSLVVLVAIGVAFTGRQHDTTDFFLARRRVPWWAACLALLATEISAVTIISVPATAYSENWEYVQFFIGSSLAKLAVAFLFIPAFYRHDVTTIYEFLRDRFGRATQVTGSLFFFLTRLTGSGARLTATAIAVSLLVGWRIETTIVVTVVVSIAYIATGGVSAVVWTNVFQALMFLVAGAVTLVFLVSQIDGGATAIAQLAEAAGRLRVIDWGPAPGAPDFWARLAADPNIVWVAVLNGFIGSMAAFGTDHDLMQRLLTVETRSESQRTLALTPLATLLTLAIYLSLGAGLFRLVHFRMLLQRADVIFLGIFRLDQPGGDFAQGHHRVLVAVTLQHRLGAARKLTGAEAGGQNQVKTVGDLVDAIFNGHASHSTCGTAFQCAD